MSAAFNDPFATAFTHTGGSSQEEPVVANNFKEYSPPETMAELRNIFDNSVYANFPRFGTNEKPSVLAEFITKTANAGIVIVTQAIKMAVFKFGIEMCAMGIKSLVETMSGLKLQPPNIDTRGVYYNFNTPQVNQPNTNHNNVYNSGYNNNRSTFSDPFANNPFAPF